MASPIKLATALVGLLLVVIFLFHQKGSTGKQGALCPQALGLNAPCPGKAETLRMDDHYLPGVVEPGQSVKVIWNWYACHPPKSGDIALVRISRDLPPRAKVIRAVAGDALSLKQDASRSRWNLFVNNQAVLDFQAAKYSFGGKMLPPIGRYIQAQGSVLGSRDVVVLSTRAPGEFDSGIFGVVGVADLVGKIERE